jgi:hypothetical protein
MTDPESVHRLPNIVSDTRSSRVSDRGRRWSQRVSGQKEVPHWLDPSVRPWPFLRWVAVIVLIAVRVADGDPTKVQSWIGIMAICAALILPDIASLAFGGVKVELRQQQEELDEAKRQIRQLQVAQAVVQATVQARQVTQNIFTSEQVIADAIANSEAVSAGERSESVVFADDADASPVDPVAGRDVS